MYLSFFLSGPKFTKFLPPNVARIVADHLLLQFLISPISIRSEDIRYQSLKLSEIVPKYGRFSFPNFRGVAPKKLYPDYYAWLTARQVEKFREVSSPSPKVTGVDTLNFKPFVNVHC